MNILITGANRGIGYALLKEALKRGHLVIAATRKPEMIKIDNNRVSVYFLDLLDKDSIEKFVETLSVEVDALINNAGVLYKDSFENLEYDYFLNTFKVNTLGPLFLSQRLYKSGKLKSGGKIINISSILGSIALLGGTTSYSYSVSKAALNMVTKLLSSKLKDIKVISVHPGWVKTDMGGKEAPVMPEESAKGIMDIVENVEESGVFLDYTGKSLPW